MARSVGFRCSGCGWMAPKWVGRCGGCGEWNTLAEAPAGGGAGSGLRARAALGGAMGRGGRAGTGAAVSVRAVPPEEARAWPTGVGELDRVLGGGIVPGSAVLLGGEPGVGKSTLLLDVASRAAAAGRNVVYASGEESLSQVAARAARIRADCPALRLAVALDLDEVLALAASERPDLLVVDSIQTVGHAQVDGSPGGVAQVRAVTAELVAAAKAGSMACLLVGHVTKDGAVAGPRAIEHLVDSVLLFEGDRGTALRWLRATKNRFGATDEVGCFQMGEQGIREVPDPSGLFLEDLEHPVPGACAGVTLDGRRPMAVGIQALTADGPKKGKPARVAVGVAPGRLAMVLAVLQARASLSFGGLDVYVSTAAGIKCPDPAMDLPLALACASALFAECVPQRTVAVGEVGLGGQVRSVPGLERRLAEAGRMGFARAIVPVTAHLDKAIAKTGLRLVPVGTVQEAVGVLVATLSPGSLARAPGSQTGSRI